MKTIVFIALLVGVSSIALAQRPEKLMADLDSLSQLETRLELRLKEIRAQKGILQSQVNSLLVSDLEQSQVFLETNMDASLRAAPRAAARVLQVIKKESAVQAIDYDGSFWKVRYNGAEGWIMKPFLDENEEAAQMRERLQASGRLSPDSDNARTTAVHPRDRYGKDLLITSFGIHPPNSAGGVGIYYSFEHLDSTRAVRDIAFTFTPYNKMGEKQKGINSGLSTRRVRRYGPISVFDGERAYETENFWYNPAISCMEIDQVYVRYSDGTHRRWKEVRELLPLGEENKCRATTDH